MNPMYEFRSNMHSNHKIDVVCFGHSHNPTCYKKENTLFINPGSVTFPRGNYPHPTYCIFDTDKSRSSHSMI